MLSSLLALPRRRCIFSFRPHGSAAEACRLESIGFTPEDDPARYRWDNRDRGRMLIFQCTVRGEGRFEDASGRVHRIPAGTGFLCEAPSPTRYWLPEGGFWEFVYLCFGGDLAHAICAEMIARRGPLHAFGPTDPSFGLLLELYRASLAPEPPDPHRTSARLYALLMELARAEPAAKDLPPGLDRARRLIEEKAGESGLGVERMAEEAGLSVFHFCRSFKRAFGTSPYAHLLQTRLRHAHELAITTVLPLKQIAAIAGFFDYPHFCRAFRRRYGTTPAAARRRLLAYSNSEVREG